MAGPIKRYPDFTAAVRGATLSAANVYAGTLRVLVGLAKKLFVADVLALTVAERPDVHSAVHAWIVLLAFTFQIYFDFSAYTDVAIGFSRMLGIALPENFRRPYLAPNIREFWNRGTSRCRPGCATYFPADGARAVPRAYGRRRR